MSRVLKLMSCKRFHQLYVYLGFEP